MIKNLNDTDSLVITGSDIFLFTQNLPIPLVSPPHMSLSKMTRNGTVLKWLTQNKYYEMEKAGKIQFPIEEDEVEQKPDQPLQKSISSSLDERIAKLKINRDIERRKNFARTRKLKLIEEKAPSSQRK